jgi:uncharacterized phage protein (TIGR02218 family)
MSYSANDISVDNGQPVEFYKFIGPFGEIRYTSDNTPGEVDGELYMPLPGGISRTAIDVSAVADSGVSVDIIVPSNSDIAVLCCYRSSPEYLTVEVRSAHRGDNWLTDFKIEWIGYGLSTSVHGDNATIKTGSVIQTLMTGNLGSVYYQRSCNHRLFDERCKVKREDWTISTEVISIEGQTITVENDQAADKELNGGEIVNTRTGEVRAVHDHVNNVVVINYPFFDLVPGDTLEISFGCDHYRLSHCKQRFNNTENYGGMDFIPVDNPFSDLGKDAIVTETLKRSMARKLNLGTISIKWV